MNSSKWCCPMFVDNKAIEITYKEDITPFVESPFHVLSCVVKIRH